MRWVFLDGQSIVGPKQRVIIPAGLLCPLSAILVLNQGHPVSRDRIDEVLWDDQHPENARDRLNTMLWRLRKLITSAGGDGKCIANNRDALTYNPEQGTSCDALDVSAVARDVLRGGVQTQDAADRCLDCIQSCHTEFLPMAQDHWTIVTRESLRSGLMIILEALIRYFRGANRWARVTELAQRMLALDPTLEIGHRQMIEMHGERHDLGSAVRHYDMMQKVLEESLDAEPAPETAAAIDALMIAKAKKKSGASASTPQRTTLTVRPSLQSVESALDHLDAARDELLGNPVR